MFLGWQVPGQLIEQFLLGCLVEGVCTTKVGGYLLNIVTFPDDQVHNSIGMSLLRSYFPVAIVISTLISGLDCYCIVLLSWLMLLYCSVYNLNGLTLVGFPE